MISSVATVALAGERMSDSTGTQIGNSDIGPQTNKYACKNHRPIMLILICSAMFHIFNFANFEIFFAEVYI